jgi:hypothetical protein
MKKELQQNNHLQLSSYSITVNCPIKYAELWGLPPFKLFKKLIAFSATKSLKHVGK